MEIIELMDSEGNIITVPVYDKEDEAEKEDNDAY